MAGRGRRAQRGADPGAAQAAAPSHREAALADKVFEIVNPFKQGDGAPSDSLSDELWEEGSKKLDSGWRFAKCGLGVEAAWTEETLGLLKQGSGRHPKPDQH